MNFLELFVFIGTVSAVVFSWTSFLLSVREKEENVEGEEAEKRILELMGKFKHMSSIRLELLDRKIEEMRKLIKEASDVYSSLMVRISEIMKMKEELGEVETVSAVEESKEEEIEEKGYEEDVGIEKKIMNMYDEGFDEVEIAKRLGIGVGEVRLIISLFRKG